jgi:hypothetical protein
MTENGIPEAIQVFLLCTHFLISAICRRGIEREINVDAIEHCAQRIRFELDDQVVGRLYSQPA